MKRLLVAVSAVLSVNAFAEEAVVCKQYGYTDKDSEFHSIKTHELANTFVLDRKRVTYGDTVYTAIDPEIVGFDKDTVTYFDIKTDKVMYFYLNNDKREIGISKLIADSDAFFGDKHLFTNCEIKTPEVIVKSSYRVKRKLVNLVLPVYSF